MSEGKSWTATVVQDPNNEGEMLLTFPNEMIDELGWKEGDTLEWDLQDNGTVILTKKNEV